MTYLVCLLGVVKVLSNVEFFLVKIRWSLITSGLANQSSPTLTTPKCIIISKNYICWVHTWKNPSIFKKTSPQSKEPICGCLSFLKRQSKGHNRSLSKEQRYFNSKLVKIQIKFDHCIGLLKTQFQNLLGYQRVIQDKQDLDAILRPAWCAFILHNLLIDKPVLPDWSDETIKELDQEGSWISLWSRAVGTQGAIKSLHKRTSAVMIWAFKKGQPSRKATIWGRSSALNCMHAVSKFYDNCHWVDFWCWAICLPWYPTFADWGCRCCWNIAYHRTKGHPIHSLQLQTSLS
jgi:hypothetical protein